MQTTKFYLERLRRIIAERENKPLSEISDYRIAKTIGVTRQAVSRYLSGAGFFDNNTAAKVAELIGEDPIHVIAAAEFERAKSPEDKARWRRLATAAMFASALIGGGIFSTQETGHASERATTVYYVK